MQVWSLCDTVPTGQLLKHVLLWFRKPGLQSTQLVALFLGQTIQFATAATHFVIEYKLFEYCINRQTPLFQLYYWSQGNSGLLFLHLIV